jgi:hypothetical protein
LSDYSEYLISARKALREAEDAANRGDWTGMADAASNAVERCIDITNWASLNEEKARSKAG